MIFLLGVSQALSRNYGLSEDAFFLIPRIERDNNTIYVNRRYTTVCGIAIFAEEGKTFPAEYELVDSIVFRDKPAMKTIDFYLNLLNLGLKHGVVYARKLMDLKDVSMDKLIPSGGY